jgi:hypothetical protein
VSAAADLNRAGELLSSALENLTLAITSSKVRLLPGVDSDAEWRRRLGDFDVRLACFYLAIVDDALRDEAAPSRRLLIESVH